MSLPIRISLLCLAILAGALVAWGVMQVTPLALAAPQAQVPVAVPTSLPNQPASALPDFSSSTPGAACVLPQPGSGDCYLTWSYLYVNSDPNYVITMTVSIDGKLRASYSGFFQTSMYIPTELLTFRVACGGSGAGGNPDFGMAHSYAISARDTSGSKITNTSTQLCPADTLRTRLPMVWK